MDFINEFGLRIDCLPMFPKFPRGVLSNIVLNVSHDLSASLSRIDFRTKDPLLKHNRAVYREGSIELHKM
jgi:hypothetical protein